MEVDAVFEGGGVKGIALVGALARLEQAGIRCRRAAGTSSGAVIAALVAAGYSGAELRTILAAQDFLRFADVRPFRSPWYRAMLRKLRLLAPVPFARGRYGIFSTNPVTTWVETLLARRGVRTFADCPIVLRVFASDITHEELLVFDPARTPDMAVAEAVRLSLTIPLLFKANRWRRHGHEAWVVDGGLLANYPIQTFDDDPTHLTIGLKIIADHGPACPAPAQGFGAFLLRTIDTMRVAHEKIHVAETYWARTIPIDTGRVSITRFDLTDADKRVLDEAGWTAADRALAQGLLAPQGRQGRSAPGVTGNYPLTTSI